MYRYTYTYILYIYTQIICVYVYMHVYLCMCIVVSSPSGSRHLVCNHRKEGIFPRLQPEVGKQAALNPKIEILLKVM